MAVELFFLIAAGLFLLRSLDSDLDKSVLRAIYHLSQPGITPILQQKLVADDPKDHRKEYVLILRPY